MKNKPDSWRIVVGVASILFILYMWMSKDIIEIYKTMPKEEILPLVMTTVAVSLLKVAGIALVVILARWAYIRFIKK